MFISLARAFITDGFSLDIDREFDLSSVEYPVGSFPFKKPVRVSGRLYNKADILHFDVNTTYTVSTFCDRCFAPIELVRTFNKQIVLVREKAGSDNDEIIEAADERFDLLTFVTENIILDMPSKFLCDEQCKGLCSFCGKNLNFETCDCKHVSSPFEVLKQFLDE